MKTAERKVKVATKIANNLCGCNSVGSDEWNIAFNAACDGFKARISKIEESDRWISVDERLPEVNSVVLVYSTIKIWTKNRIFVSDYTQYGFVSYVGITHWQPLPPSPKS